MALSPQEVMRRPKPHSVALTSRTRTHSLPWEYDVGPDDSLAHVHDSPCACLNMCMTHGHMCRRMTCSWSLSTWREGLCGRRSQGLMVCSPGPSGEPLPITLVCISLLLYIAQDGALEDATRHFLHTLTTNDPAVQIPSCLCSEI